MKPTNEQIIKALEYLETENNPIVQPDGITIDEPFGGYIAAFGGAVVQMGLLPAVMLYDSHSDGNTCRQKISQALFDLYKTDVTPAPTETNFYEYLQCNFVANDPDYLWCRKEVMQWVIALKMAMRTFKFVKL